MRYIIDRSWYSVRKVEYVDLISMIVGALVAGAATGLKDNVTNAVKDASARLAACLLDEGDQLLVAGAV